MRWRARSARSFDSACALCFAEPVLTEPAIVKQGEPIEQRDFLPGRPITVTTRLPLISEADAAVSTRFPVWPVL